MRGALCRRVRARAIRAVALAATVSIAAACAPGPRVPPGGDSLRPGGAPSSRSASVSGLPLVELAAAGAGRLFAVIISGDGGWVGPDKGLSRALRSHGVSVVGISSPRYLARSRTPDGAARDLARIIRHYGAAWGRDDVVVIGYSRGADIAPSMVTRLPDDVRRRVVLVALLGPSRWSGFGFHLIDVLVNIHYPGDVPVRAEIARLRGTPVLCIYGRRDRAAICPSLDTTLAHPIERAGGHLVKPREGPALADSILAALR